jgi:hypothetical protein
MTGVELARLVGLIAGIVIVLVTMWNVFTALVLPRVTSSRIPRGTTRVVAGLARGISPRLPTYLLRDRMLSFVGPASMILMFGLWLCLLMLGFGLIIWWNAGDDFASAIGVAGSSIFTLGIASARGAGPHTLEILTAGVGLLVIALEIAYLPALYNAFAARETEVTLLEARGGAPGWGPEILARHYWLDNINDLPPLYLDWERWAAAVSESHANYPSLLWFRSPVPRRHWLVGLVAMMDSAALYHAVSPDQTPQQARLCLSMGIRCLRSIARALKIPFDADPLPTAGTRLTRAEFDEGFSRLEEVHFPMERDADEAWRNFQGWRVNYESIVDRLTQLVLPPPAPWFVAQPALGEVTFPVVTNRTPDAPEGTLNFGKSQFGKSSTFNTPSRRESNRS